MYKALIAAFMLATLSAHAQGVIGRTATVVSGGHRIDAQTDGALSKMPESLFTDCVLWQTFSYSDNSNADFYDLSTAGTDGTQTTAASQPTWSSASGGVYDFDGVDDYIHRSESDWRGGDSAGAITAWVNSITNGVILSSADESSLLYYFKFELAGGKLRIGQRDNDGADFIDGTTIVSGGTWNHVALLSSGTAWSMYVNGAVESLHLVQGSNSGDWFADTTQRDNYVIGAMLRTSLVNAANGYADDVRVYSRVLTSNEVFTIYNTTKGTYGL